MRAATIGALALAALASAGGARRLEAQSLAQRIRGTSDGTVTLYFTARPGVCGDGRTFFSMGRRSFFGQFSSDDNGDWRLRCAPGPARVRMRLERGTVTEMRTTVGPEARSTERTTDLGRVAAADAAAWFLAFADTASGRVTHEAITAAVLADSASVWRRLLGIATDTERVSRSTRRHALFWVGRFVAAKITGHGEDIAAAAEDDDRDTDRDDARGAAVFALSQLRGRNGIDALLQVARTHRDPEVRRQAIFWLGESGDARALALFREILVG